VLKEAGRRISESLRSYDFVGRYGGEEFLAVLSNCTPDELHMIAERARCAVAESPISTIAANVAVTVSIGGVVTLNGNDDLALLAAADAALYEAKRAGRNRVVIGATETISTQDDPASTTAVRE
jgi:diguanylate cyclase (GGDEF)-like protein